MTRQQFQQELEAEGFRTPKPVKPEPEDPPAWANGECLGLWCVAVKKDQSGFHVRDTKDPSKTTLSFSAKEWENFTKAVKDGQFD